MGAPRTQVGMQLLTQEVLIALLLASRASKRAHVPTSAIVCRFARDKRGFAKRELRTIARSGLAFRHPTRGETTWQLTANGVQLGLQLHKQKNRT